MSRKGNALGNRLGLSKDWVSQFGFINEGENIKNFTFIYQLIINTLLKLGVWFLDIKMVQKKNILNVYILISYLNSKRPIVKKVFLISTERIPWFYLSSNLKILSRKGAKDGLLPKIQEYRKKQFKNDQMFYYRMNKLLQRYKYYRILFLKMLSIYLETLLIKYLKYPVKIYLYNAIDFYKNHDENNIIINFFSYMLTLYPNDQNSLLSNIKTSVFYLCLGITRSNSYIIGKIFASEIRRHKKVGKLFKFFFKIIREFFYVVPLLNNNNEKQRAEFLKIQISGKIDGQMRAVKQIYSFHRYKGKEIPIQTLKFNIDYSLTHSYTFAGVLGIKVWIF